MTVLADQLDAASLKVERQRTAEIARFDADLERAWETLRRDGHLARGGEGADRLGCVNSISLPAVDREANDASKRRAAMVRAVAERLRVQFSVAAHQKIAWPSIPFRLRASRAREQRRTERTKVERSAAKLIARLAEVDAAVRERVERSGQHRHADPAFVHEICTAHLHSGSEITCSFGERCPRLALCRALYVIAHGLSSPLQASVRDLANAAFAVAGSLQSIARWLRKSGHHLAACEELEGRAVDLLALDESARESLRSFYDASPRGLRPRQAILVDATYALSAGGFSIDEIANLLDDGGDPIRREQRIEALLKRQPATWIRHVSPATTEQIERARREPGLVWATNGAPYRMIEGVFHPA